MLSFPAVPQVTAAAVPHLKPRLTWLDTVACQPWAVVRLDLHVEGEALPHEFLIFPKGEFETTKGTFAFTEESAKLVMEHAKKWGNRFSLDYEHKSLTAAESAGEGTAPAAGWYKLELRDGALWAVDVEWTPKAAAYLKQKEYRYYSPAFRYSDDKVPQVLALVNCALTNLPATTHMKPLAASIPANSNEGAPTMKSVISFLKLSPDAGEGEVLTAVSTRATALAALTQACGTDDPVAALAMVKSWKEAAGALKESQEKLEKLAAKDADRELELLLDKGVADGKVVPATREAMKAVGQKDIAALSMLIEKMPALVPTEKTRKLPPDLERDPKKLKGIPQDADDSDDVIKMSNVDAVTRKYFKNSVVDGKPRTRDDVRALTQDVAERGMAWGNTFAGPLPDKR